MPVKQSIELILRNYTKNANINEECTQLINHLAKNNPREVGMALKSISQPIQRIRVDSEANS